MDAKVEPVISPIIELYEIIYLEYAIEPNKFIVPDPVIPNKFVYVKDIIQYTVVLYNEEMVQLDHHKYILNIKNIYLLKIN